MGQIEYSLTTLYSQALSRCDLVGKHSLRDRVGNVERAPVVSRQGGLVK